MVVVVRYYGGIKLGKGGLSRAYSSAASSALAEINTKTIATMINATLSCDYALEDKLRRTLFKFDVTSVDASYDNNLTLNFVVTQDNFHLLRETIIELSGGRCQLLEKK